ncbi:MAG: hypothetical protein QOJ39_3415 [Candidatus Eremiobacteraeota bacterium]|nr:hypothetical protein [Candidatus Eremiobacteraeota bacterium]
MAENEYEEFAAVVVDTLSRERTLFEKLAALHHVASSLENGALPERLGTKLRHAYDVGMLLGDRETISVLRSGTRGDLLHDIEQRSMANEFGWTARPSGGYANSPAFDDPFIAHASVQEAYERALELVVGGPKPSLQDVAAQVRAHADLL